MIAVVRRPGYRRALAAELQDRTSHDTALPTGEAIMIGKAAGMFGRDHVRLREFVGEHSTRNVS